MLFDSLSTTIAPEKPYVVCLPCLVCAWLSIQLAYCILRFFSMQFNRSCGALAWLATVSNGFKRLIFWSQSVKVQINRTSRSMELEATRRKLLQGKCVDTGWIESVLPSRYSILIFKKNTDKRNTRKNAAIVGCECYWRIHILHLYEESWDTYNFQHGWYNSCLHEQFVLNISNTIPTHKLSRTEKMLKSCNCTWISHLRSRTRAREPRSSKLMVWSPFTSKLSKSVQALPMAFFRLLKSDISGTELAFEVVLPLLLVSRWIRTISYQWLQWLMIPGRWEECSVCIMCTSSKCVFVQYRLIYLVLDTLQE